MSALVHTVRFVNSNTYMHQHLFDMAAA